MQHASDRMPVTVSVVMATYNGERFLPEQLASIAAQTRLPDELLIIDDGSSDGTPALLADWARDKPWVRLDRNPRNLGINATFWRLLTESRGSHVFISDQDDVWMPEKIEVMLAQATGALLAYSDARVVDAQGTVLHGSELSSHGWQEGIRPRPEYFVHDNFVSGHNMMVARALIRSTPEPPHASVVMYDQWLALSATLRGSCEAVACPLALHRIHARNAYNNADLKRAARAGQSRRERALARIARRRNRYQAADSFRGVDPHFDRFIAELQAGSAGIEARWWSTALFRALWARRHLLRQDRTFARSLRFCVKTALGGRAWRFV